MGYNDFDLSESCDVIGHVTIRSPHIQFPMRALYTVVQAANVGKATILG